MQNKSTLLWLPLNSFESLDFENIDLNYKGLEYLPFLLMHEDAEMFKQTGKANISKVNLLFGIVYGFDEIESVPTDTNTLRTILLDIFDQFFQDSKEESMEIMLLNMAVFLRQELGLQSFVKFLNSSLLIAPSSSLIKRDILLSYWLIMANDSSKKYFQEIIDLYEEIDLNQLPEIGQKAVVSYYIFSLVYLKEESVAQEVLEKHSHLLDPYLIALILEFMRNPDEYGVEELVFTYNNLQRWEEVYLGTNN